MKRKRYPKNFKEQLVKEAKEVGNALSVAKRHGISEKTDLVSKGLAAGLVGSVGMSAVGRGYPVADMKMRHTVEKGKLQLSSGRGALNLYIQSPGTGGKGSAG